MVLARWPAAEAAWAVAPRSARAVDKCAFMAHQARSWEVPARLRPPHKRDGGLPHSSAAVSGKSSTAQRDAAVVLIL